MKKFIIEGHRGVQSLWPENTLDSFREAIDLGLDFVELDVLATSDDALIIHHDYAVEGRLIRSLPLCEVKKIDCGSFVNSNFPEQRPSPKAQIPLLKELFDMVQTSQNPQAKKLHFNLEIKSDPSHPEYTMPLPLLICSLLAIVRSYQMEDRVYYSSFDPEALFCVRRQDPKALLAFLYVKGAGENWLSHVLDIGLHWKMGILSPHESLVSSEVVNRCKAAQIRVIPWTVNELGRYIELKKLGVDGIITDYPQRFFSR